MDEYNGWEMDNQNFFFFIIYKNILELKTKWGKPKNHNETHQVKNIIKSDNFNITILGKFGETKKSKTI